MCTCVHLLRPFPSCCAWSVDTVYACASKLMHHKRSRYTQGSAEKKAQCDRLLVDLETKALMCYAPVWVKSAGIGSDVRCLYPKRVAELGARIADAGYQYNSTIVVYVTDKESKDLLQAAIDEHHAKYEAVNESRLERN